MIVKMNDGAFYELTEKEYKNFICEMLIHFSKEETLTVNHIVDTRVEAAKLLLNTVAQNNQMSQQMKDDYFKVAFELIEQYNFDLMARGEKMYFRVDCR
jgi:hypothetical protein